MRATVIAAAALALASFVGAASASTLARSGTAVADRLTALPAAGLVVPGQSIGGITLGMTEAQVQAHWGSSYIVCTSCGPNLTWLYVYPGGDAALGAAVKFTTSSTTAVTTSTVATDTHAASVAQSAATAAAAKASSAAGVAARATAAEKAAVLKAANAHSAAANAVSAGDKQTTITRLKAAAAAAATAVTTATATATKDATAARLAATLAKTAQAAAVKAATVAKTAEAALNASSGGTVTAVFTLGSPINWGLKGIMMGDPVSNVYSVYANPGEANCLGYSALTVTIGSTTTSFYSASGVIYGYALTPASQSPCE